MFVTFEGPEGAGKSTAIAVVAEALRARGFDVLTTREPGAGATGKGIRALLLDSDDLDSRTELFLFLADRAQHVASLIRPALEAGRVVLCDRHADSTVVYQGYGRGLDIDWLRSLNAFATGELKPDLTVLFDLEPAVGLARLKSKDRLDREPLAFHTAVRNGFLVEAAREPERWRIIDASAPPEQVAQAALDAISLRK